MDGADDGLRPAREIVDVDLGGGVFVRAEVFVEPEEGEGRADVAFGDRWRKGRRATLDRAAPTIEAMARWVHGQVAQVGALAPDRVGVEMSVKFVARTPGIVAPVLGQVGAESTLLVRLEWDTARAMQPGAARRPPAQAEEEDDDDSAAGPPPAQAEGDGSAAGPPPVQAEGDGSAAGSPPVQAEGDGSAANSAPGQAEKDGPGAGSPPDRAEDYARPAESVPPGTDG